MLISNFCINYCNNCFKDLTQWAYPKIIAWHNVGNSDKHATLLHNGTNKHNQGTLAEWKGSVNKANKVVQVIA